VRQRQLDGGQRPPGAADREVRVQRIRATARRGDATSAVAGATLLEMSEIDVSPDELAGRLDEGWQLVDVRTDDERAAARIAGDVHIALDQLTARADEVADRPVVFYCRVGNRSTLAAQAFRASGFDAHSLAGGIEAYEAAGLPVERG
jgi:rhodanese-related sulfurtransferase